MWCKIFTLREIIIWKINLKLNFFKKKNLKILVVLTKISETLCTIIEVRKIKKNNINQVKKNGGGGGEILENVKN